MHILTMGSTIYSNDDRIEIVHPNRSDSTRNHNRDDWILRLHDTLPSDSGIYECQINTEPKKSKAYVLQVVGMSYFFVYPLTAAILINSKYISVAYVLSVQNAKHHSSLG